MGIIIKPYLEKIILVRNPSYPGHFLCGECEHEYERHFDGYDDASYRTDGCKYCDCTMFVESIVKQGDTICHSAFPPGVKPSWSLKVIGVSIEHDQIWVENFPKRNSLEKPELRSYDDTVNNIRRGEWIVR